MAYYKATIDVLVDVADEAEACDCIAEALRPLLLRFMPGSSVIDWRYSDAASMPEPDTGADFEYADAALASIKSRSTP